VEVVSHSILEGHRGAIYSLLHKAPDNTLISGGSDGWIVEWDLSAPSKDGRLLARADGTIFSMVLLNEISYLVAGDMHGQLFHIDLENKTIVKRLKLHAGSIFALVVRGQEILSCGGDGYLVISDLHTGLPKVSVQISSKSLRTIEIIDDIAFIGCSDGHIYTFCLHTLQHKVWVSNAHHSSVFSLCPGGENTLYSGGRDARLVRWKMGESPALIHDINAHWFTINKILYLDQLGLVITASRDKNIRLWCSYELNLLKSIDALKGGHINSVNICCWIPEGQMLVSAGDDRSIKLWKISR
jgi:WD40 repeat protein